ncbi:hypothetical protein chiPu_0012371 [Chiloscyllium punctatum]|uniref:Uncharacterized protein n=1 Tax=Chiloscyllium punctatum TaxID=137246 RepID=A0A401SU23_CHIPU|nr:hypothetical protein [Chiloscyllium punctatum]
MSRGRFIITFIKGKNKRDREDEAREEEKQDDCNFEEQPKGGETSTFATPVASSGPGGTVLQVSLSPVGHSPTFPTPGLTYLRIRL